MESFVFKLGTTRTNDFFFFSSRRRHTRCLSDWSSDVCSSDLDFGTAVTYDAINADGDYLGGAIAPGVEISLDALVSQTAMLRRVEPVAPDSVIGRNTVASIQSGLVWGFVAQVEGMVKRMADELGGTARVVATGGQASLVAGLTPVIETTDPLLTLDGLRLIYAQNSDGGART